MKEGLIPTVVGTGVVASGIALRSWSEKKYDGTVWPTVAVGVIGFGLAHVLLGTIDLFGDRY